MPITKSAKKALRQSEKRRANNRLWKTKMRDAIKTIEKIEKLAAAKNTAELKTALSAAYKTVDKAAKRGIIKKNKAARIKSRLAKSATV